MNNYWTTPEKSVELEVNDGDIITFRIDGYDSVKIYIREGVELDENTKRLLAALQTQDAEKRLAEVGETYGVCGIDMAKGSYNGDCGMHDGRGEVGSVGAEVGVSGKSEICGEN